MKKETKIIHDGHIKNQYNALAEPIYKTSTFIFDDVQQGGNRFAGKEQGYIYSRLGNPTVSALQRKLASLENAEAAVATSSGMGAISSVMWTFLKAGDHVLADRNLYGCTYALFMHGLTKFGIQVDLVDLSQPQNIIYNLKPNTRMVFFETPSNPSLKVIDIEHVAMQAHNYNKNILVVVDNTFATPYLQQPLSLGADLVVHSLTKYINGHGDLIAGAVIGSQELITQVNFVGIKDLTGAVMSSEDAFMILRGIKTLAVRMEKHCENTKRIVEFLKNSQFVKKINYPGLSSHHNHNVAKKQMKDFGAVLSFETNLTFEQTKKFVNSLKIWTLAVSLGDVESLIEHPASMTHATYCEQEQLKEGITPTMVRLSVGLEDPQDLIDDLMQGFVVSQLI